MALLERIQRVREDRPRADVPEWLRRRQEREHAARQIAGTARLADRIYEPAR